MTKRELGTPVNAGPRTWVQTERAAHEAWGRLTLKSPRAASVMHHLVANMGHQNAIVIGQKTLAKIVGCNERTVRRALDDLERDNWIQTVQIGPSGTVNAYVVNSAVAWGEKREHIGSLTVFHSTVIADAADQRSEERLERKNLRKLPMLWPDERQLPDGEGEHPGQPSFLGYEPDLPAKDAVNVFASMVDEIMQKPLDPSSLVLPDPATPSNVESPAAAVARIGSAQLDVNARALRWIETEAKPDEIEWWKICAEATPDEPVVSWARRVSGRIAASGVLAP